LERAIFLPEVSARAENGPATQAIATDAKSIFLMIMISSLEFPTGFSSGRSSTVAEDSVCAEPRLLSRRRMEEKSDVV
jgi:hypothetical protein